MTPLLLRAGVRHLARHPWQLALAVVGVAIGVAVVVGVDLASESARRAFRLSTEATSGRATHQVTGGTAGLDERVYSLLRLAGGVRAAAPVVELVATLPTSGDRAVRLLGIDPFAEGALRPWLASGSGGPLALAQLVGEPGAALLGAETAAELGVAPGDRFPVRSGGRTGELRLAGLLAPDAASRAALSNLLVADVATAQELAGTAGLLTRIDLLLPEGVEGEREAARLAALLATRTGVPARLEPAASRPAVLDQMTRAFRLNLAALSLLALLCGAFLIYNTMRFAVLQRRELLGRLRALGVRRGELVGMVLGEAAAVALAGTALGLAAGVALGRGIVRLVLRTVEDLYFTLTVAEFAISPLPLAKGALLGIVATLAAAYLPARAAAAVPPRATWTRSTLEEATRRRIPRLALAGLAAGLVGALTLALPSRSLPLAFAGLFLVLAAGALLVPPALLVLLAGLDRLLAPRSGILARLAVRSVAAALSRTGVAVAALSLAVAVTVGADLMVGSFRGAVVAWLDRALAADLYLTPEGSGRERTGEVDPALAARLSALPGVAAAHRLTTVETPAAGSTVQVVALDLDGRLRDSFRFTAGDPATAWRAVESGTGALAGEPLAARLGLAVGDALRLGTDHGEREIRIAGVVRDYGSERGSLLLARPAFEALWEERRISGLGLVAAPGADLATLAARVRAEAAGERALLVQSQRELRDASLAIFDRTFLVTGVLRLLTLAVAVVGVLSALLALALERGRELAVLRANGLTPRQLWRLVTLETGLVGGAAGLLAMPLGVLLAAVMVHVINRRSFGWSMELLLPAGPLLEGWVAATAAALLAGLYPAWRMARTSPAVALREE